MLTKDDIIVYIPVYQDKEALDNCLTHLEKLGLRALVVDGRFTDFPQINNSDNSTDGSMNMVVKRGHYYHTVQPCREEIKLNYAMQQAFVLGYNVFMYIGADAFLQGNIDEFLINLQRHYERFVIEPVLLQLECVELQPEAMWNNTNAKQPRVLLNFNDMEARHLHWAMFKKGARDNDPLYAEQITVEGLKIIHDNTVRPKERDDLMTEYQNKNVPRERALYQDIITPKEYEEIRILIWIEDKAGSYSKARIAFLQGDHRGPYTHLIFVKAGNYITEDTIVQFHDAIVEKNRINLAIPILTAVWDAKKGRITLDPQERYLDQLPNYPKLKELYSKKGTVPNMKRMGVSWTVGPIICINEKVVRLIDNMGDDIDFMTFCNKLDLMCEALTEIRV